MDLLYKGKNYVALGDENKIYHFTNLVGSRSANYYEYEKDNWKLTSYEENMVEGKFKIDTIQSDNGEYISIIIHQNGIIRHLNLCCDYVLSDVMYDTRKCPFVQYTAYVSDNKNKKPIPLEAYFSICRTHEREDGSILAPGNLNNQQIKEFIEADKRMSPSLNTKSIRRVRVKPEYLTL